MKSALLTILFLIIFIQIHGQKRDIQSILKEFQTCKNDSLFVSKYSSEPYGIMEVEPFGKPFDFKNWIDSLAFFQSKGDIVWVLEDDSIVLYLKILSVDSAMRMKAGNIWLNTSLISKDSIDYVSNQILKSALNGADFDKLCQTFTGDKNTNFECGLSFFQDVMVDEFETQVLAHKKGDIFIAKTRFGTHVVKILEDAVLDRNRVQYVGLFLLK